MGCPNTENPYHECNDWCEKNWGSSSAPKPVNVGHLTAKDVRAKPSNQFPKDFSSTKSANPKGLKGTQKKQPQTAAGMGMYANVGHSYGSSSSSSSEKEGKKEEKEKERTLTKEEIEKIDDPRKRKLAELKARMSKAMVLNRAEVRAEAQGKSSNQALSELVKDWDKQEEEEEEEKQPGSRKRGRSESAEDLRHISAEDAEWHANKKKKKSKRARILVDYGVEQSAKAYGKRLNALDDDEDVEATYERQKNSTKNFYRSADSLDYGNWETNPAKVDKMANEVKALVDKRKNYSRRREFFDDADVTYINESNRKLNQKIAKFYDEYTVETRQNLERGTAL
mmetsp:Transcript_4802/g.7170  ORF Transcript_4802/g.7170 Transcript_4802/m.7170 type:complete len:339 (-) Transcript_4802:126-1142(-)